MIEETFRLFKKVVMNLFSFQNCTITMSSFVQHINQTTQRLIIKGISIYEKEVTALNQRLLYLLLDCISNDIVTNDMMIRYCKTHDDDLLEFDKKRLESVYFELKDLSIQLENKGVNVNEANIRNTRRVLLFA